MGFNKISPDKLYPPLTNQQQWDLLPIEIKKITKRISKVENSNKKYDPSPKR